MRTSIMQKLLHVSLLLLMAYICWGCTADREEFCSSGSGKGTRLTFSVSLPAKASTYSLDVSDENNVSSVYVLAFKYNNSQYELSDWSEAAGNAVQDDGSSNKKKFTITFTRLKESGSYKFVLLANVKDEIDALFQSGLSVGAEKNSTLQNLQLSGIARWNIKTSDSSYRDIPMWGETPSHDGSGDKVVSQDMSITGLSLLRMVARINVLVNGEGDTPATSYFKLKSVHLYNTNQDGQVVPEVANLVSGSMLRVEKPTLVSGSSVTAVPIVYDENTPGCTLSDEALNNSIYTFETEVPRMEGVDNVVHKDLTCLVIGGEFETDGKTTFYRVNLNKKEANGKVTYLDVLRNHSYNIKIVKIKGSGYDKAEDAFNAKALNMEAEVVDWDDGEIGEINESGGYRLVLSPGSIFGFYRNSDLQTVNITTDYPGGWKVIKVTEEDKTSLIDQTTGWLKVDKAVDEAQGADGSKVTMTITAEANDGDSDRTGYIYIKYANSIIHLTVNQTIEDELGIEITSGSKVVSELLFTSMNEATEQNLNIKWSPKDSNLEIVNSKIGSSPAFKGTGVPSTSTIPGGNNETGISYVIKPTAFTTAEKEAPYERVSKLDLTTGNGFDYASASVLIRHINYGLLAEDLSSFYVVNGNNYDFTIKSNASWRIKSVTEILETGSGKLLKLKTGDNLKVGTIGNANLSPGMAVKFTTNNVKGITGRVKVVFESNDYPQKFVDKEIILEMIDEYYPAEHAGWAGSNIYWDGEKLTFDDVATVTPSQGYQGIFFQWGSLNGIAPYPGTQAAWVAKTLLYKPDGTAVETAVWSSWPLIVKGKIDSTPPVGKTIDDRAYLYEITNASKEFGDICKHLTDKAGGRLHGKKWRMPTKNEFGGPENYTKVTLKKMNANDASGKYVISYGATKDGTTFFPASGVRMSGGAFANPGLDGYYYSSSYNESTLNFSNSVKFLFANYGVECAHSIRCVVVSE